MELAPLDGTGTTFDEALADPGSPVAKRKSGGEVSAKDLKALGEVVFQDHKWEQAAELLSRTDGWGRQAAKEILEQGAKSLGFWQLPEATLAGLVDQLMGVPAKPSAGLQQWTTQWSEQVVSESKAASVTARLSKLKEVDEAVAVETHRFHPDMDFSRVTAPNFSKPRSVVPDWRGHFVSPNYFRVANVSMHVLVFGLSAAYASDLVIDKYPDAVKLFSWPIWFARLGGMATSIWTALLFLSMSRALLSSLSRSLPRWASFCFIFLDSHKDFHIEAGKALCFYSSVHVTGHTIGTVPGVMQKTAAELNKLLGCAQADPPWLVDLDLSKLYWPMCPLTEENKPKTFTEALFLTVPGVTGAMLTGMLALIAWTSRQSARTKHFDTFWNLHNVAILSWPIILFFHGSQGWVGVGIPLVVIVSTLPLLAYFSGRIFRLLRYYLFVGKAVKILRATVRLGKDGGINGSLTQLEVTPPPYLWSFHAGMYAFICMPDYAPLQWHPFTITSGMDEDTVNFLVAGVGDWSNEVARRCLKGELPRVALDGPFVSPTQSAMDKEVLVAIGAGVGVTPFLSLLSTFLVQLSSATASSLVEAHFYWITRDPCEFIFGSPLLRNWLANPPLHAKIVIHLYTTAKGPGEDLPSFLFKECLKRQSAVDRDRFRAVFPEWQRQNFQAPGCQLPWSWAEGGQEDLLWVTCPTWDAGAEKFRQVSLQMEGAGPLEKKGTQHDPEVAKEHLMVPVTFGRPNFLRDIASIGRARPDKNLHVYVCGNDTLVHDLQSACQRIAQDALQRNPNQKLQQYLVHFERFG